MKRIQHQWGADYLVYDEPIHLLPTTLTSPQGITLQPGQQVTRIGKKPRSSFQLLPGHHMIYEGLLTLQNITYAIFHCPDHDDPQLNLFGNGTQYRYAFTCVFVKEQFHCFLLGAGGSLGMAEIILDKLLP